MGTTPRRPGSPQVSPPALRVHISARWPWCGPFCREGSSSPLPGPPSWGVCASLPFPRPRRGQRSQGDSKSFILLFVIFCVECSIPLCRPPAPDVRLVCHLQPDVGPWGGWLPQFQHLEEHQGRAGAGLSVGGSSHCRRQPRAVVGPAGPSRRPFSLPRGRSEEHVDFLRRRGLCSRASESRVGQVQRLPLVSGPGEPRGCGAWGLGVGVRGAALWGARAPSGVAFVPGPGLSRCPCGTGVP